MFQIVRLMDEQQSINKKIANQIPVIVQKSVQEQSKKPKRKGFLSIFGKKEGTKPTTTTTTLRSSNRNMVNEQNAQSRRLSEQADSLAARNAELNRQLQGLICQIEKYFSASRGKNRGSTERYLLAPSGVAPFMMESRDWSSDVCSSDLFGKSILAVVC